MGENKGFTKPDMDRVGLFQEMGYVTIGDRYKAANAGQFNEAASKGKQVLPGGSKRRSALQAGYFSDRFNRVMEAEAYSDPIKTRRQQRLKEAQKNLGKPFLPSSGEKRPSGLGSHYGTLSGPVQAFSAQNRPRKEYKSSGKNFYTNPGKQGTGYGYVPVTISAYHKYETDPYERPREMTKKEVDSHKKAMKGGAFKLNMAPKALFDENPYRSDKGLPPVKKGESLRRDMKPFKPSSPAKNPGGMKAGTFDLYPSHSADPYKVKVPRSVNIVNKSGKTFMPSQGPKSVPQTSVMHYNVERSVTSLNHRTISSVMAY